MTQITWRMLAGAAVIVMAPLTPAAAQFQAQVAWCANRTHGSLDVQISGCAALIDSGKLAGKTLAWAHNNRGLGYRNKGDFDRAFADFGEAIALDPTYTVALYNRGNAYDDKGDHVHAIADYDAAIRLDPTSADAFTGRCAARAEAGGDLQQALADCNQSLNLRANDAAALDSRGFTYLRLGQFDSAIADYNAALKVNPKLASALYGRGLAKQKKGDSAGGQVDMASANLIQTDIADEFAGYGVK
jgi:tetratricopeptide (TPR) repeat protein